MCIGRKAWLVLILLLGITLPLSTTVAADDDYIYESNWSITVDFIKSTVDATLLVEVWQYEEGTFDLLNYMSSSHPLDCNIPSSVFIEDGMANFYGEDGIRCELPSIQKIVAKMTNGDYKLPEACSCKTGAIVQSDITLMPNKDEKDWQNPLATLNTVAFAAPILASNVLRTNLEMMVSGQTAVSTIFPAQSFFQLYEGSFDEINPYPGAAYNYFNSFTIDGDYHAAKPGFINQPLLISNVEPALHIGYDPATGEGLHGSMSQLFVDPGCFGNGGY